MSLLNKASEPLHIAVVIPAYQEERLLPVTLAGIPSIVKSVIIVDDASTDATRKTSIGIRGRDGGSKSHSAGVDPP